MSERVITLFDREEMLGRLLRMCDSPHFQKKLYPLLLENAGQQCSAHDIIQVLTLAIFDFTQDMSPTLVFGVSMYVCKCIDALTDDVVVAQKAKDLLLKY